MKVAFRCIILCLACLLASAQVQAKGNQRVEAIEQLEQARKAAHPIEHLEKAKHHLEKAHGKLHSQEAEAITRIDRAIEAKKNKDHKLMERYIKDAITELRRE